MRGITVTDEGVYAASISIADASRQPIAVPLGRDTSSLDYLPSFELIFDLCALGMVALHVQSQIGARR
jgi:hypothetical protein